MAHVLSHDEGDIQFFCENCDAYFPYEISNIAPFVEYEPFICRLCKRNCLKSLYDEVDALPSEQSRQFVQDNQYEASTSGNDMLSKASTYLDVEKHSCSVCHAEFLILHDLENRECNNSAQQKSNEFETYHKKKSFLCETCGKIFSVKGNLKRHKLVHRGEKQFQCKLCGKYFSYKCNLQVHMRTHTGEKPFKCEICGNRFTNKRNLNSHIQLHTTEKSFHFEICKKEFVSSADLKRHMRTNTGEKPFECIILKKGFNQRSHAREKQFQCETCLKRFFSRSGLKIHMQRIHPGQNPFES